MSKDQGMLARLTMQFPEPRAPLFDPVACTYRLTRWSDVAEAATAPDVFGQFGAVPSVSAFSAFSANSMAACDGAEHRRKRSLAFPLISRSRRSDAERHVVVLANDLIDAFASRGRVWLFREFARELPVRFMLAMLGLPSDEAAQFITWFSNEDGDPARTLTHRELQRQHALRAEAAAYLQDQLIARHKHPRHDLLSEWLRRLDDEEPRQAIDYLVTETSFLFFAGTVPVAHMLTMAVAILLQDERLRQRAYSEPVWIPSMLDETLRLCPPVPRLNRTVRRDVELGSLHIPSTSTVELDWAAANRDAARFDAPNDFDPGRKDLRKRNLTFGIGPHRCLGSELARLLGRVGLQALFARLHEMRLASPWCGDHGDIRRIADIELTFAASGSARTSWTSGKRPGW